MNNTTTASCPVCGAPLKWGGQITMPEEDPRAGQPALYFAWRCGHEALLPIEEDAARRLEVVARGLAKGHPIHECGAGDHDVPYRYRGPSADHPGPFSPAEYARLLCLRGRAQDGAFGADGYAGVAA